jgi:type II secretory pathway pseudopilin PulG
MRLLKLKLMPLVLMINVVVSGYALPSFAQNTDSSVQSDVDLVLAECDVLLDAMALQRDRAIRESDMVETERDEARGQLKFVLPRLAEVEGTNARLQRQIEEQPSRLVWAGVGAGVALVAGGLVVYLALAL